MNKPFTPGTFYLGCNYWASHAGTRMWSDWNEEIILNDLKQLKDVGVHILRVFPLWSDFQPLVMHRQYANRSREVRMRENPLPDTVAGRAGVDELMAERFEWFLNAVHENGMRVIIGLLTGWMSGRMHVPQMLDGRNVLTDPFAIRWEVRFVRYMVRRFHTHSALLAWDLGNECNCMGEINNADSFFVWMSCIANTIRSEDNAHPIVSGMHSLRPMTPIDPSDQGEVNDIVCTHPYPAFTPYCNTDPLSGMKSALHAPAESVMYAGMAKKPCFVEEIGTLGPMFASEEVAADYLRSVLLGVWRHDCLGLMWWCGFDQSHLTHTPYDWNSVERQLGLLTENRVKPVGEVFRSFHAFLNRFPIDALPQRITDAVCILSRDQDQWAAAYGAFILAEQAHLTLQFAWCEDAIPRANVFILPSLCGDSCMDNHHLQEILRRVREDGAKLYLSLDNAILSPFQEFTGLHPLHREMRCVDTDVRLGDCSFLVQQQIFVLTEPAGAHIMATTQKGEPIMSSYEYGRGTVFTLAFPIERITAVTPGIVDGDKKQDLFRFYQAMELRDCRHMFNCTSASVGLTEYPAEDGVRLIVQNYAADELVRLSTKKNYRAVFYDSPDEQTRLLCSEGLEWSLHVPQHSGCVIKAVEG